MNIYDISRAAGVSIASVSRVINDADNVSEKTRQKVLSVIEEMGYTPNAYARGLGRGSMKTIGIMCSDSSDIYLANAIYYLETSLRANGYNTLLCCTGYDLENKKASFELLKSRQVDAVIMVGSKYVELEDSNNDYIREGAKSCPVLLVNGSIQGDNIYCIYSDDAGGMKDAVERLCASGARKLLYIYSSDSCSGRKKIAGIREGCRNCGIPQEALRIVRSTKDFSDVAETLSREYHRAPFDAVITSSDTSGVGALKFALREGIRIPEALSIVSFNNSVLAEAANPELTSIDNRLADLCSITVDTLLRLLNPEEYKSSGADSAAVSDSLGIPGVTVSGIQSTGCGSQILLSTQLVERGTTRFHSVSF